LIKEENKSYKETIDSCL